MKILLLAAIIAVPDSSEIKPNPPRDSSATMAITEVALRLDSLVHESKDRDRAQAYFDEALNEQANRFALIITSLLVIVGGLTFAGFRHEVRRLESELREAISANEHRTAAAEASLASTEVFTKRMAGNTFAAFALMWENQGASANAIIPSIIAAAYFYESAHYGAQVGETAEALDRRLNAAKLGLRRALKALKGLTEEQRVGARRVFKIESWRVAEAFETITRYADRDSADLAAEVRVLFGQVRDTAEDAQPAV